MNFRQVLAIMLARRHLVLAVFGTMVLAVLVAAWLRPPLYRAQATLVTDLKADPLSAPAAGNLPSAVFLATQVDIVRSERVARLALVQLDETARQRLLEAWTADELPAARSGQALAEALHDRLDVRPARDSGVITVAIAAPDPVLAAALANAVARAGVDLAVQLRVEQARQFSDFFQDRVVAASATLKAAQTRLRDFQAARGLLVSDERLDIETTRLSELSSQLTTLQSLSADSASRQAQAQDGRADRLQEVLNHPLISQIKAEIGRAEAQQLQLAQRLGDRHPQLMDAQAQLSELRERLAEETRRVGSGAGVAERIHRQREAGTRTALDAQRTRVQALRATRDEARLLQREVDLAQRATDALQQRLQQSSLESQSTQTGLSVLSPATPPLAPLTPPLALQAALGVLLGAIGSVGLALALELRRRRVHTADDLASLPGLTLLVCMPGRDRPARRRPHLVQPRPYTPAAGV